MQRGETPTEELTISMKNLVVTVERGKIVITADLRQELGTSKSGKSVVIASTHGNLSLKQLVEDHLPEALGNVRIGLNIFRPKR
jgi:predicted molibdopterin-dependent oxidoreductase YjgC